jgi:hypothetical protein
MKQERVPSETAAVLRTSVVPKYRPPKYGDGMVPEYQRVSWHRELWIDVKLLQDLGHQPLCDDGL